jgi:hypothetical protein
MAYTVAVTFRGFFVELRDMYPICGHTPSSIDREEFIIRWNVLMPAIDNLKNLKHDGLASIGNPKYNEFCAGTKDGSDDSSASKLDYEDLNDVERDVQDIVIHF